MGHGWVVHACQFILPRHRGQRRSPSTTHPREDRGGGKKKMDGDGDCVMLCYAIHSRRGRLFFFKKKVTDSRCLVGTNAAASNFQELLE